MLNTPITVSVGFAQLAAQFRAIVREELAAILQAPHVAPAPATGGIELAMEITRLSKSRIYSLAQQRRIPHSKTGNVLHFVRAELLAWIQEGKRQVK